MTDDRVAATRPVLPIGATATCRPGFGVMQLTGPGHWGSSISCAPRSTTPIPTTNSSPPKAD